MNYFRKIEWHHAFWIVAFLFLIGSFLPNHDSTLEINVHDTYFVIAQFQIYILLCFVLGCIGIGYWIVFLLQRKLYKTLTVLHFLLSLIGILAFVFPRIFSVFVRNPNQLEYPFFQDLQSENVIITIGVLLIVFAQLFYVINLIFSIVRKKRTLNK